MPLGAPCRLVIEQYEELRADNRGTSFVKATPVGRRLVYSDIIPLAAPVF